MQAARSGTWEEAAAHFQKAVELSPGDASARLDLSMAFAHNGDRRRALAEAREALRLAATDPRVQAVVEDLSHP